MTQTKESEAKSIGLSDFIDSIRSELEKSEQDRIAAGKGELFAVENVELELSFTIRESSEFSGGFSLKIISADAAENLESTTIHKAKISMSVGGGGSAIPVLGSRPYPTKRDIEPL